MSEQIAKQLVACLSCRLARITSCGLDSQARDQRHALPNSGSRVHVGDHRTSAQGMLSGDRINIRRSTQAELQAAADRGDRAGVCRAARKLGAGKPKPPLKLLSADEKQLLDTRQTATRLHEHIACLHDSKTITCEELKKQVHENAETVRLGRVDVCDIPSKGEITATSAHMSLWKTFGEDNLPPTLFNTLATVYHPLFVKCAMWIERPIQWKGCHLAFFLKKSGTKPTCANMREIGLAPVPA